MLELPEEPEPEELEELGELDELEAPDELGLESEDEGLDEEPEEPEDPEELDEELDDGALLAELVVGAALEEVTTAFAAPPVGVGAAPSEGVTVLP